MEIFLMAAFWFLAAGVAVCGVIIGLLLLSDL
jgi:hypothetical protein